MGSACHLVWAGKPAATLGTLDLLPPCVLWPSQLQGLGTLSMVGTTLLQARGGSVSSSASCPT